MNLSRSNQWANWKEPLKSLIPLFSQATEQSSFFNISFLFFPPKFWNSSLEWPTFFFLSFSFFFHFLTVFFFFFLDPETFKVVKRLSRRKPFFKRSKTQIAAALLYVRMQNVSYYFYFTNMNFFGINRSSDQMLYLLSPSSIHNKRFIEKSSRHFCLLCKLVKWCMKTENISICVGI